MPHAGCGYCFSSQTHTNQKCVKILFRKGLGKNLKILKQDIPRMHLAESISECVREKECFVPELVGVTIYYACDGKNKISKPNWDWSKLRFKVKIGNHCFYEEI